MQNFKGKIFDNFSLRFGNRNRFARHGASMGKNIIVKIFVVFLRKKHILSHTMENCLDTFRSYVKTLGEKLKIEGLDLDENNDCYLSFDGKYFVKCSLDVEKEQFNLLAYIGSLPEDKSCFYRGILESCHFWSDTAGANVSLDPADGTLVLTQYSDMNMINGDIFYSILEKFINAMEHWDNKQLEAWMATTDDEAEPNSATAWPNSLGMPGTMALGV
ncbi:MAG: type III secretion system chaperone [Puniceicoccales bacterium]|nr:type III secretion system chaperone [Puniceicoccales bacterium]